MALCPLMAQRRHALNFPVTVRCAERRDRHAVRENAVSAQQGKSATCKAFLGVPRWFLAGYALRFAPGNHVPILTSSIYCRDMSSDVGCVWHRPLTRQTRDHSTTLFNSSHSPTATRPKILGKCTAIREYLSIPVAAISHYVRVPTER